MCAAKFGQSNCCDPTLGLQYACDYTHTATMANTSFRRPSYCLQDEFPGDPDPLLKCVGYTLAIYFEDTSLFCRRISINGLL